MLRETIVYSKHFKNLHIMRRNNLSSIPINVVIQHINQTVEVLGPQLDGQLHLQLHPTDGTGHLIFLCHLVQEQPRSTVNYVSDMHIHPVSIIILRII